MRIGGVLLAATVWRGRILSGGTELPDIGAENLAAGLSRRGACRLRLFSQAWLPFPLCAWPPDSI